MIMITTNNSGKFLIKDPISGFGTAQLEDGKPQAQPVNPADPNNNNIPECPTYKPSFMDNVRRWFGEYWWVWIIALVLVYYHKEN